MPALLAYYLRDMTSFLHTFGKLNIQYNWKMEIQFSSTATVTQNDNIDNTNTYFPIHALLEVTHSL